jgi:hypothetical protein
MLSNPRGLVVTVVEPIGVPAQSPAFRIPSPLGDGSDNGDVVGVDRVLEAV